MKKILVMRFSDMGDVALLVPVIRSLVFAYAEVHITVVTQPKFASFFNGIDRVTVFEADLEKKFRGFFGVRQLFRALFITRNFDIVIDAHDHVRSIVLRSLFKIFGKPVITYNPEKKEKKDLIRKENKKVKSVSHTVDQYKEVFERAGFQFPVLPGPYLFPSEQSVRLLQGWFNKKELVKKEKWIGLAPFSSHKTKQWPLPNYPVLIDRVLKKLNAKFFLYGGGDEEIDYCEELQKQFPDQIVIVAGRLKMPQQNALMHHLDVMVSMASANMHIAALCGIPVLSIWGGTHTDSGFSPYGKGSESIIEIDRSELPCRPCSISGKETCYRGDFACLTDISVETVAQRILNVLA